MNFKELIDAISVGNTEAADAAFAEIMKDKTEQVLNIAHEHVKETFMESELQIDELSKDTLVSYAKKATMNTLSKGVSAGGKMASGDYKSGDDNVRKGLSRVKGVNTAINRLLKKESVEDDSGDE